MSKQKTLISEIVTGLGTLSDLDLDEAFSFSKPPAEVQGVDDVTWNQLADWWAEYSERELFVQSFEHGRYFLASRHGLRERRPELIEWKGPHRPPEQDPIPCDLRIDHVFSISCKNLSKVLRNSSPSSLFRTALKEAQPAVDWYFEVAPREYSDLLVEVGRALSVRDLPKTPIELDRTQRDYLKASLAEGWPEETMDAVRAFTVAVSQRSADQLRANLSDRADQLSFYWRLMRLHSAPYFILGTQRSGAMRLRVLTPWDFQRRFRLTDFDVWADEVGQPQVAWRSEFLDQRDGKTLITKGHFEIRWSHGKFCGSPEGKIYLDSAHAEAAGYEPI